MPRRLPRFLTRVHQLASGRKVRLTAKADREIAALGLDPEDVREVLAGLTAADSAGRLRSQTTGEWLHVFKPRVGEFAIYLKLIIRSDCLVVSFHEDEGDDHEEDQ